MLIMLLLKLGLFEHSGSGTSGRGKHLIGGAGGGRGGGRGSEFGGGAGLS
jgi:hypothetical protein